MNHIQLLLIGWVRFTNKETSTSLLTFIQTAEGRVTKSGSVWTYEYNLKDHLGNVRVSFRKSATGTAELLQKDDYYPFGMVYSHPNVTGDNKYLNQGKEFQIELSSYDFEARMYDPVLGRTFQMDPMAFKYYSLSPYSWVANNPLLYTDPTGMEIDWSGVSREDKRIIKAALRKHNSSDTYKNLYKQLKKSDNRYVIKATKDENSMVGASFDGNTSFKMDGPDGETLNVQNPGTSDDFKADEKGGIITFNMAMVEGLDNKTQASILGDFAVEEIVHGAQYDDLNQKDNSNGLPGTANTEFEAKTIVGQIQSESKRELWTNSVDQIANSFGVNAFKSGNTNGYQQALKKWYSDPRLPQMYKARTLNNTSPALLERLIKK